MKATVLKEVLDCLCGERTLFYYYPDQYAVYLVKRLLEKQDAISIRELRNSRWASLLNRPSMQQVIADCGDGKLRKESLEDLWLKEPEPYVLTLGKWGNTGSWSWNQTSRPGSNLVLQLNLTKKWSRRFQHLVQETANDYFDRCHPLSERRDITHGMGSIGLGFRHR